jgi:selenocysteine lyase/cysteine desulfurase
MATPLPRDAFALDKDVLWVMHCAEGPVPRVAAQAVARMMERELRPWQLSWKQDFLGLPERARAAGARVLGVDATDVTLTPTTSSGLVTLAQGLDLAPGDEVLLPLGEFPANAWPWLALTRRGVTVREVPLWEGHRAGRAAWESSPPPQVEPENALVEAIGPRTRVLAASWVRFQDGLRLNLEALGRVCRRRGVRFVVDGIQGAGTLVPDLEHVDAFATGGHKGLLAPQGLGLLWTTPELRAEMTPLGGWLSVEQGTDFARPSTDFDREWLSDGQRLEQGVPNLVAAAALAVSLELLADAGVETIAAHVDALEEKLLRRLSRIPSWRPEAARLETHRRTGRCGAILALHHDGAGPDGLDRWLRRGTEQGIYASAREGYLRVALHGWHDDRDIERIARWLAAD